MASIFDKTNILGSDIELEPLVVFGGGGKKKDKAKKYFYKLLVNPKTTYLKYKEHLYVKFNNYLLSVKNLQEYIYSKDIKQVKNSKKKKKNLNNIICKYYNLIKN